jgi:hypothetical protein
MKAEMRALWLIVLVVFLAGCSTARLATWPGSGDPVQPNASAPPEVAIGDRVTVELHDGSTVQGRIVRITEDLLTLETSDRTASYDTSEPVDVGLTPYTIMRDTVRTLTMEVTDGTRTALLVIGVGAVVGGAVYYSSNFKPLGESGGW